MTWSNDIVVMMMMRRRIYKDDCEADDGVDERRTVRMMT